MNILGRNGNKIIEGSAVLKGKNYATPTISVTIPKQDIEPLESTQKKQPRWHCKRKNNYLIN